MADPVLCGFLKSKGEVLAAVRFLQENGYMLHHCEPKNWDLAHILPHVSSDGNFLDMGSWESAILANLAMRDDFRGELYGIDLQEPTTKSRRIRSIVGDLTDTKLPGNSFRYISCVSVIEHGVDFAAFAAETSRLLQNGGKLWVTFDYWEPRITAPEGLYGLPWQPLDRSDAERLVDECISQGLLLAADIRWETSDPLIDENYCSPLPGMEYTFGLLTFVRQR